MLWLTMAALAAEAPLEVEGMPESFWVNDPRGRQMSPRQFAKTVGDDDVHALYRRSLALRYAIDVTGWVGGGALVYAGLWGSVGGAVLGSPQLAGIGLGTMGTGGLTIALATVNHIMWGRRLDDYSSFYSYEQVVALVDAHNEASGHTTVGGSNRIDVFPYGSSIAADIGDDRLTPGEFAEAVGDPDTYRLWSRVRLSCNLVGWTSFGVGAYLTMMDAEQALLDLAAGQMTLEVFLGASGVTLAVVGPLIVYGTKFLYNDLGRYYTLDEAAYLATGVRAAAPKTGPEVELYPTAVVVRW